MSRRLHGCISCDGKTRHDNPARCSKCRAYDPLYEIEDSERGFE
jgi:hypothetical protein